MNPSESNSVPQGYAPVLVSVVIPTYNASAYIAGTLESVFAQTFPNYEVIVVNDGSADTPALEKALEPYRTRIKYLAQPNQGPSSARNAGIRAARGKYIALLDSDDLWFPNHLEQQVRVLESDPALGLLYANGVFLVNDHPTGMSFENSPQSGEPTLEALLREQCTVTTSSTVVRREVVLQAGLFDETFDHCEDFELWLRVARNGVRIDYRREPHIYHRLTNGLAANRLLMKQGRARAYEKTLRSGPLTEEQQGIIRRKLTELEVEIQLEVAKDALLAGQYAIAQEAVAKASTLAPSLRLRLTEFGLHYFPGVVRALYRPYVRRLERYKRSRSARLLRSTGFSEKAIPLAPEGAAPPGTQGNSSRGATAV